MSESEKETVDDNTLILEKEAIDFQKGLQRVGYTGSINMKEVVASLILKHNFPAVRDPAEAGLVERVEKEVSPHSSFLTEYLR